MSRVEEEVRSQMAGVTRPGLVAVSGGPDSVALLRAIKVVCPAPFTVVHVNHKLRGVESEEDEAFVQELAETLNVPFRSKELPIQRGESIETTARNLRYDWFRDVAKELNCAWLATAHTADDQVETVLHRIIRGTGLQGLTGIQADQYGEWLGDVNLLRPLIEISRNDILEDLKNRNQPYRIDSSNVDTRFTRNRIRNEVIPMLRQLNPGIKQAIYNLSEMADGAHAIISGEAERLLEQKEKPRAGNTVILELGRLIPTLDQDGVHPYLVQEMFRLIWQREKWPVGEMTYSHWQSLAGIAVGSESARDFPGGVSVRRVGKVVQLRRKP